MELEKKKAKKLAEQKKSVDTRLEQEMKRNTDLQKEMYRWPFNLYTCRRVWVLEKPAMRILLLVNLWDTHI